jgi:uncharacterized protein (DUF1501 family)
VDGWITRLWNEAGRKDALLGLVVGNGDGGPFKGDATRSFFLGRDLNRRAPPPLEFGSDLSRSNPMVQHLAAVQESGLKARTQLRALPGQAAKKKRGGGGQWALNALSPIFTSTVPIEWMVIRIPGFDTHVRQAPIQNRLLKMVGDGLGHLRKQLIKAHAWNETLVVVTSEFGRRVRENASGGTDHGKANHVLVLGGAVRGGVTDSLSSLSQLDDGDLPMTVDYRSVLATIAHRFLGYDTKGVLRGADFGLPFLRA